MTLLTLGSPADSRKIEGMEVAGDKRFMHQYNMPPYSSGEVAPLRGPKRREIGHGKLAERALMSALPDQKDFPYIIRLEANITESNGSSSMASVCSGCLSLMDAGVPIKRPVSGIAMGLILEEEKFVILSDIMGAEDALGDMDFKITGDENGITAFQMIEFNNRLLILEKQRDVVIIVKCRIVTFCNNLIMSFEISIPKNPGTFK